jgi:hypothetical protein
LTCNLSVPTVKTNYEAQFRFDPCYSGGKVSLSIHLSIQSDPIQSNPIQSIQSIQMHI